MAYILNSPIFTGNPQAPTPITSDSSTSIATTAYVKAQGYGVGTVTAIGVTTANGVSGSSSGGATPNLTIALGAITPTSVNGLTLVAAAQGFTIAGGTASKTMTFKNSITIQGTDAAILDVGAGGTLGTAAYTAATAYEPALGNPGTNGWVLSSLTNGTRSWVAMTAGFSNPMTTTGDIMIANPTTTAVRLGIGTTGYVLTVVAGLPAWSNTPTLTGTNFTGIPNAALTNSAVLLGAQTLTLGAAATTTLTGMVSITSTTFVGALTGNASGTSASFTGNLTGDVTSTGMATTLSAATVVGKLLAGYVLGSDSTALASTDSIILAFAKLQVQSNLKAPINNPTFTGTVTLAADPTLALQAATKQYVDAAVVGLLDDRGTYNASVNTFPASGGSGSAGAVLKGDIWYIGTAGTLGGIPVPIGASVRALVDAPGQTAANWGIVDGPTINATITDDTTNASAVYPLWVSGTGTNPTKVSTTKLSFVPNTGLLTATGFVGSLTGTASLATALAGGATNQIAYQTGAGATSFFSASNYGLVVYGATGVPQSIAGAAGVLVGSASAIPAFSTTPTLTGTNFTGIPGTAINSAVANATLAATSTVVLDTATAVSVYPLWSTATSGSLALKATTALSFVPSTGILSATGFAGPLVGNVTGNCSGTSLSFTGTLTGDVGGTYGATTIAASVVVGKALTGFVIGTDATQLAATDTMLQAFQKLQYQINVDYLSGISTKSTTYNPVVVTDKFLRLDATGGAFAVTLMAAPPTGYWCMFKKIDSSANAITISGNGKTIDGSASTTISAQWNAITLQYNGTTWDIL